jgi:hypothetical protein
MSVNGADRLLRLQRLYCTLEKYPMDTTTLPLASIGIDIGKEVFRIVGLPPNNDSYHG